MATPHDARLKEFQKLIDAATRQLKVQDAAKAVAKKEEETTPET